MGQIFLLTLIHTVAFLSTLPTTKNHAPSGPHAVHSKVKLFLNWHAFWWCCCVYLFLHLKLHVCVHVIASSRNAHDMERCVPATLVRAFFLLHLFLLFFLIGYTCLCLLTVCLLMAWTNDDSLPICIGHITWHFMTFCMYYFLFLLLLRRVYSFKNYGDSLLRAMLWRP